MRNNRRKTVQREADELELRPWQNVPAGKLKAALKAAAKKAAAKDMVTPQKAEEPDDESELRLRESMNDELEVGGEKSTAASKSVSTTDSKVVNTKKTAKKTTALKAKKVTSSGD